MSTSIEMRYYGVCNLLAELSRRYASLCFVEEDESGIMDRVEDALRDSCENSKTIELWGTKREGFTLNVNLEKGEGGACAALWDAIDYLENEGGEA